MANLSPVGGPKIWSGNQISTSISSRIPVHLDADGCTLEVQLFPRATLLLIKLAPLWEHGIHNWSQIICRGQDGRPYFMEGRELQWANPSRKFPPRGCSPEPYITLGYSCPLRTQPTCYPFAIKLLIRKGPMARPPPDREPLWVKTGAPSPTDPPLSR